MNTEKIQAKDFDPEKHTLITRPLSGKVVTYRIGEIKGSHFIIADDNEPRLRHNGKPSFYFSKECQLEVTEDKHIWKTCDCNKPACWVCDGLSICRRCGLLEGSLTTDCPGVESYAEHNEAVYTGMKDFVDGHWQLGTVSKHSPEYNRHLMKT